MFQELLEQVLRDTPGAIAVTLMGFDGITVANCLGEEHTPRKKIDFESVAIELGSIASQLKRLGEGCGVGDIKELVVEGEDLTTVLRPVTQEYFVALSMQPGSNSGKGRYILRALGSKLVPDLT